jgi:hypothetical protein
VSIRDALGLEPFDLEAVTTRNAEFLMTYISMAQPGGADDRVKARLPQQLSGWIGDSADLITEVQRLYGVLRSLRDQHLPLAGEPGAEAICTGCSLHGTRMPWPCETYRAVTGALPERRP